MTKIRFSVDDREIVVDGDPGRDLMHLALDAGVDRIIGECGGEMSCGTCHVHVRAPWKELLVAPSVDERELLDMIEGSDSESRLACQLKCRAGLDEVVVEVAK